MLNDKSPANTGKKGDDAEEEHEPGVKHDGGDGRPGDTGNKGNEDGEGKNLRFL